MFLTSSLIRRAVLHSALLVSGTIYSQDPGTNTGDLGTVTFSYKNQQVTYATVRAADGKIWLQQNLGSSQVAAASTDTEAYGDLFQWGRWDDGHQTRNSTATFVPAVNNPTGIVALPQFIIGASPSLWWGASGGADSWTAANASSVTVFNGADPCKALGDGWQMPSESDWGTVISSESFNNAGTAFSSSLKLPVAGNRSATDAASFVSVGTRGYYWTSDSSASNGRYVLVSPTSVMISNVRRGQGLSVRCFKDSSAALGTVDIKKDEIRIYPNPASDFLYFKGAEIVDFAFYNSTGQKLAIELRNNIFDLKSIPSGIYFLTAKTKEGTLMNYKVIKK